MKPPTEDIYLAFSRGLSKEPGHPKWFVATQNCRCACMGPAFHPLTDANLAKVIRDMENALDKLKAFRHELKMWGFNYPDD